MKNKKSQIPDTLTWFVAFIIIFFIIILFITASIIIAGQKEMAVFFGENSVSVVQHGFEYLELNRNLIKLLNTRVEFEGEKIKIRELIIKWDVSEGDEKQNIERTLKLRFNQELDNYYFTVHRNNPGVFLVFEGNPKKVSRISDFKFSLIYLASDKGLLAVHLSFTKYEAIPI